MIILLLGNNGMAIPVEDAGHKTVEEFAIWFNSRASGWSIVTHAKTKKKMVVNRASVFFLEEAQLEDLERPNILVPSTRRIQ